MSVIKLLKCLISERELFRVSKFIFESISRVNLDELLETIEIWTKNGWKLISVNNNGKYYKAIFQISEAIPQGYEICCIRKSTLSDLEDAVSKFVESENSWSLHSIFTEGVLYKGDYRSGIVVALLERYIE